MRADVAACDGAGYGHGSSDGNGITVHGTIDCHGSSDGHGIADGDRGTIFEVDGVAIHWVRVRLRRARHSAGDGSGSARGALADVRSRVSRPDSGADPDSGTDAKLKNEESEE